MISIPISSVHLPDEVHDLVDQVLRSGMLAQGPRVAELEALGAEMAGTAHAVAVNNGTTALVLALETLGIGPGDEVVTSPFTFVATLNAILESGATARFADIGDDFCCDPDEMAAAIGVRTRVLLPVHLYGQPADMAAISDLAAKRGLDVVEDSAQSHGARVGNRRVGSYGLGCFSLYGTKNLTTGEGGLITTDDASLADRMRVLRNQGMRNRYEYVVPGHNYRLTDLQAAVGIPQFHRLGDINSRRSANAAALSIGLTGIAGLTVPTEASGRTHVWHQYTVRVTDDAPITRDEFVDRMNDAGVGCGVYYPRTVFDYDCYRDHPRVVAVDVPRARLAAAQVASLPVHPDLTAADLDRIVTVAREALDA